MNSPTQTTFDKSKGHVWEVFWVFLLLGVSSFGGPAAHLARFRDEFVTRRGWVSETEFAQLLALCHFLPGPSSSQTGMALGLQRAGWLGMLSAWFAFTVPSALLMVLFALGYQNLYDLLGSGFLQGLKLAAVAVVAHAVVGMAKNFCTGKGTIGIFLASSLICLLVPGNHVQLLAIFTGLVAGLVFLHSPSNSTKSPTRPNDANQGKSVQHVSANIGIFAFVLFLVLLVGLPAANEFFNSPALSGISGMYQSGALVFGGGHVVLPLIQSQIGQAGLISQEQLLAGYAAAQTLPGPLFAFSAYLGATIQTDLPAWLGGLTMLIAVFLPGVLILIAALPFWATLSRNTKANAGLAGINASVTGVLFATLLNPVGSTAIHSVTDLLIAVLAFSALYFQKLSPLAVIAACALVAYLL